MNLPIKRLLSGAFFLCVGAAHAAAITVTADGVTNHGGFKVDASSAWSTSSHMMGAFYGMANATFLPTEGATLTWEVRSLVNEFGDAYQEDHFTLGADVPELTADDKSGTVITASSVGGLKILAPKSTVLRMGGGWAELGELDVRFQADGSVNVFGVITGQGQPHLSTSTVSVNHSGLLFTARAADVAGSPLVVNVAGTHETTLHNLVLSTAGLDALASSFGVHKTGLMRSALEQAAPNFGDLALTVRVTAVPEPSAWALLGFGLAAMGLMGRRRGK